MFSIREGIVIDLMVLIYWKELGVINLMRKLDNK